MCVMSTQSANFSSWVLVFIACLTSEYVEDRLRELGRFELGTTTLLAKLSNPTVLPYSSATMLCSTHRCSAKMEINCPLCE